jgi:hypothetical protein
LSIRPVDGRTKSKNYYLEIIFLKQLSNTMEIKVFKQLPLALENIILGL